MSQPSYHCWYKSSILLFPWFCLYSSVCVFSFNNSISCVGSYIHHHSQDTEQFHDLKDLWCRPFYNHYYFSPPLSNAPPTLPQDPLICPLFSIILSFQWNGINGIIYYISFWNWLFFTENNSLEINPRANQQCFLLLSSIPWCGYTVQPFACGRSNFWLLGVICHAHSWTGFVCVCVCEHKPPFL